MTTHTEVDEKELAAQEHCIDLPGETVQCWIGGGTDKLKVILRKHRDVIFDIHLGNRKSYTLETTESDFYCVRDKKLVFAAQQRKTTFQDGERLHVWVSRGFRGSLVVRCEGHVLSEVKPNIFDSQVHTDDPKEKPAPIIIALGAPLQLSDSKTETAIQSKKDEGAAHEEQSLHIQKVSKEGAPPALLKFFQDGGESLHLDSEDIITRNWIIAQLAGGSGYVLDNHTWIKELKGCKFHLHKIMHKSGPTTYMIFNGNNKLREVYTGSKYSLQHTKVMRITGGAGGTKQSWDTAKGAAKDSLKVFAKEEGKMVVKGGGVAVFFAVAMDVAEWYKDYSESGSDGKPKKDLFDLFAKVGTDLVKAGLVAALATASVACMFGFMALIGATVAAPVIFVVVGTIAASIVWAYAAEKIDKAIGRALGEKDTTTWFAKKFREIADYLCESSKDERFLKYSMAPIF